MEEKNISASDDINLVDYIKVISKRKKNIVNVFLLTVAFTGAMSFLLPKVYKVETSIEIGRSFYGETETTIEDPVQVKGKIDDDIYGTMIRKKMSVSESRYPKMKTENLAGTSLVTIKLESSDASQARDILGEVNNLIIGEHESKIKSQRELMEKNIKIKENKIALLADDAERIKNKIKATEEESNNLDAKVATLQKVLPYQQDPGAQFALYDAKERLANTKRDAQDLYSEINSTNSSIENLNSEINTLKSNIENIRLTQVVKAPAASERVVSPNPLINMIIGAIAGLFLGVLWAFGREWWENHKKELKTS